MRMLDFLRRRGESRTFQRLYEYWLGKDVPPVEDVPHLRENNEEKADSQSIDEGLWLDRSTPRQVSKVTRPRDSVQLRLPIRYVFLGAAAIALLLVMLSIVLTVLIMRSC